MNQPGDGIPGADTDESSPSIPGMRSKPSLSEAIRHRRRAALVVNTRSRRGRRLYPVIRTRLDAAGFSLLESFPASRTGGLGASLTAAMELRPDLLIVGGGDGTISEAARRLAYRDMALGIRRPTLRCRWRSMGRSAATPPPGSRWPPRRCVSWSLPASPTPERPG